MAASGDIRSFTSLPTLAVALVMGYNCPKGLSPQGAGEWLHCRLFVECCRNGLIVSDEKLSKSNPVARPALA